jgi:ACS family tartrate transporter-like MFS transporter
VTSLSPVESRIAAQVRLRILLPCALLLFVSSIDRANMSFAAAHLNRDLGLSPSAFGFAAGIFFIGYLLAQFPSVALLGRVGMHRWAAAIALLWGLAAAGMAFVNSAGQLYALRLLLGIAEAGLAPGIMIYLNEWGSERSRASMVAIPLAAIPMSLVIGGPLSGLLLDSANPFGLADWRWMFLAEGVPAIILAGIAFAYFPDHPRAASWLDNDERAFLEHAVGTEEEETALTISRWAIFANGKAWLCAAIWFCVLAGNYGVIFWLPQVISSKAGLSATAIGFLVALPWLANVVAILWNAKASDQAGERYLRIAIPAIIAGAALLAAIVAGKSIVAIALLIVLGAALGAALSPFWALPRRLLPPGQLAFGITLINILGSLSGLIIPVVIGAARQRFSSFTIPMAILASIMILAALLAISARRFDPAYADRS